MFIFHHALDAEMLDRTFRSCESVQFYLSLADFDFILHWIGMQNIVITMSVVYVCLSVHMNISGISYPDFIKFCAHFTYNHSSIVL